MPEMDSQVVIQLITAGSVNTPMQPNGQRYSIFQTKVGHFYWSHVSGEANQAAGWNG